MSRFIFDTKQDCFYFKFRIIFFFKKKKDTMLSILPIDSGRYGTIEMVALFKEQKKINYQLEIEGATAVSQSEIGMIPKAAGKEIQRASRSGKITVKRIKQLEAKSDHDTAALVEALSEKCKLEARPWVHYGL